MIPANANGGEDGDPRDLAISKFRQFVLKLAELQAEAVGWAQTALDLAQASQQCLERLFAEHPELRPAQETTDPEEQTR